MLTAYLRAEGFSTIEAADGIETVAKVRSDDPDLVILDVGMPGIDGFEALRQIRSESDVPVIMLTARTEEVDRVIGLTVGADDYVSKPFSPRELAARIKAVLRRGRKQQDVDDQPLRFEGLVIDPSRREVIRDGEVISLSALEFDLLAALAEAPGRVFTRQQLLERVWGAAAAVKTHSDEKRAALRNAVLTAAIRPDLDDAETALYITWIDQLTEWHLRLLVFLHDKSAAREQQGRPPFPNYHSGGVDSVLVHVYPELEGRRKLYDLIVTDLNSRGLITINSLHTTGTAEGYMLASQSSA